MRITVEIDASRLKAIQRITGQKKKSPALATALEEFLRQYQKRQLISRALSGRTDYPLTNDDLEAGGVYDPRG